MEKISVVIPTYNRANQIEQAIQSVIEQTYQNLEILVVDDGSTDETEKIVRSISDERIRYIRLERNSGGPALPRNIGVKNAEGSIIAFLDSDDRWLAWKLEHQMEFWKQHPEYAMIYCTFFTCSGERVIGVTPGEAVGREELSGDILLLLLRRNTIGAPTILLRKESFDTCGGYDSSYQCLEDWEFVLRFSSRYQIGFLDEVLVEANYTPGSVSGRKAAFFESRCRMIAQYKEVLWKNNYFDEVVGELLHKAAKMGMLQAVQQMLGELLSCKQLI